MQGHSLEDGTFKSGPITIGDQATLGTGSFVHYGATIGDAAIIDADSFVMKGEHIPPRSRWQGNPAASVPENGGSRPPAPRRAADKPAG